MKAKIKKEEIVHKIEYQNDYFVTCRDEVVKLINDFLENCNLHNNIKVELVDNCIFINNQSTNVTFNVIYKDNITTICFCVTELFLEMCMKD